MKVIALFVLLFAQTVLVLIAVWQVMGMLPVLSWLSAPSSVTGGMWFAAGIKFTILLVAVALWWLLGRLRIRIRDGKVSLAS